MRISIMQPYFLPYIGYFQLMAAADTFVVYDDIEYTKKGWINRNRFLQNGKDAYFTVPVKKDSDFLTVRERRVSEKYAAADLPKTLARLHNAYRQAPFFKETFPLICECFSSTSENLFDFIFNSIKILAKHLDLQSEIIVSSSVPIDSGYHGKERVLAICAALKAKTYINSVGGRILYDKEDFRSRGVELKFLQTKTIFYPQFDNEFVPHLSIVDVLMFNSKQTVKEYLNEFEFL